MTSLPLPSLSSPHIALIRPVLAMMAILFHLSGALYTALETPFPASFDERQHISYVLDMAERPELFPPFAQMRTRDDTLEAYDGKPNYLNHPSLYYQLMALLDDSSAPAKERVFRLRLANMLIATLAIVLMLGEGIRLLPNAGTFALFAATLVMFPKLALVGGLINNDTVGLLAGALGFVGLSRLHRAPSLSVGVILGLAIAIAGWTKLTVLLMVGFAVLCAELLHLSGLPQRIRALVLAGAVGGLGAIPTLHNLAEYGRLLYVSPVHYRAPSDRPSLDFLDYLEHFLGWMVLKWPALEPAGMVQIGGLVVIVIAGLVLLIPNRRRTKGLDALGLTKSLHTNPVPAAVVANAYVASTLLTLAVHIFYGWLAFQSMGDVTSPQPRYYYAVWPGVALSVTLASALLPGGRPRGYAIICCLALFASATLQAAALSAAVKETSLSPH